MSHSRCPMAALEAWAAHLAAVGIEHAGVVLEGGHPSLQLRPPDGIALEWSRPKAVIPTG